MASHASKSPLKALRKEVCRANVALAERNLARFTFGNASGIDRERGLVAIKPSGVPYDLLTPAMIVVTDIDGKPVSGELRPSSDLPTHLVLYRAFEAIGGISHTHSPYATAWAQAGREIPCYGTTHADCFEGAVPLTRQLELIEIAENYEENTGHAIVKRFEGHDPLKRPAVLVAGHASFSWGRTVGNAIEMATVLEEIAMMAYMTTLLNPNTHPLLEALREKHFLRKHGEGAYYGQKVLPDASNSEV